MTNLYDNPGYQPPADIQGPEARAYENAILRLMRKAMLPDGGSVIRLEAIELRGDRPDTEVIFLYTDSREPGRLFAQRTQLWKGTFHWALESDARFADRLNDAHEVAADAGGAFSAHECEPIEVPDETEFRR